MLNIPGSVFAPAVLPAFADLGSSIVEANAQQRGEERRQRREDRARALMKSDERERLDRARARAAVMAQQLGLPSADYGDPNDVASIAGIQNTRTGLAQNSLDERVNRIAAELKLRNENDASQYPIQQERKLAEMKATQQFADETDSQRRARTIVQNAEETEAMQDTGLLDPNINVPGSRTNWGPVMPQRLPGIIGPKVALDRQDQAAQERHQREMEDIARNRVDGRPAPQTAAEKQFEAALSQYARTDISSLQDSVTKGKTFPNAKQLAQRRKELREFYKLPPDDGATAPAVDPGVDRAIAPGSKGKVRLSKLRAANIPSEKAVAEGWTVLNDTAGAPK